MRQSFFRRSDADSPTGLGNLAHCCQTLVHDTPERSYRVRLVVKKILEKPGIIERSRIGVPLTLFTVFGDPIAGFASIKHFEQARRIEIGSTRVIENAKFAGFDSYNDVRMPGVRSRYRA